MDFSYQNFVGSNCCLIFQCQQEGGQPIDIVYNTEKCLYFSLFPKELTPKINSQLFHIPSLAIPVTCADDQKGNIMAKNESENTIIQLVDFVQNPNPYLSHFFTPLEFIKAIYGIAHAFSYLYSNNHSISLNNLLLNTVTKEPLIFFVPKSDIPSECHINELYHIFSQILYLLSLLTFDTDNINQSIRILLEFKRILPLPFGPVPFFIKDFIDKLETDKTIPFQWIIDQISVNANFVVVDSDESINNFTDYAKKFVNNDSEVTKLTSRLEQEDLPYSMDPWIYFQTQSIIDLQTILFETNEDTLEGSVLIYMDSIYHHDIQLMDSFVHYIIIAVYHRPKNISIITKLIKRIIDCELAGGQENIVNKLKESILRLAPDRPASYGCFGNANPILSFLHCCYLDEIFNDDDILNLFHKLTDHLAHAKRVVIHMFAYFAPMIKTKDPPFFQSLSVKIVNALNYDRFPQPFTELFANMEELEANDWSKLKKMMRNENGIREIIQRDDIASLRELAANPNFDINMRVEISLFETFCSATFKPTILQYSAFYGSIKIFRYLLLNGANVTLGDITKNTVVQYAIAGGCIEIVRICEQERMSFDGALEEAVSMYQNEIFEWLHYSMIPELPKNNLVHGSIFLNAARTNNIKMIMLALENNLDVNAKNEREDFPLYLAALFGYNDVIRVLLTSPELDVNQVDSRGNSALMIAAQECFADTVWLLLSHPNIDLKVVNDDGVCFLF